MHEQITISAVSRLLDSVYTFVSIDTLRNPENPIANVFDKIKQSSLVPLVIVDESHGLGRYTKRRTAIADLVWGPREFDGNAVLRSPGALVVYMTGTPVHPNPSETASRLGLLDVNTERTPHKPSNYDNVDSPITRGILQDVKERAVIRRKEGITLDGTPGGAPLFPKRLVFPFQKWSLPTDRDKTSKLPDVITNANKDVLMAIDQYVAREASHGAKLVSLIRQILRSARDWPEIKQLVKDTEARKNESSSQNSLGKAVYDLAQQQRESTVGDDRKRWESLWLGLEAALIYEEKLMDARLENLTWKMGRDENGKEERQMLFTKVGWIATAYDSLVKGGKKTADETVDAALGDVPDEDKETVGELSGPFDSLDDMLKSAQRAKRLADEYLDPIRLDDDSKVRFSMLVALLEDIATLKLWEKSYESMADEDRFGWGVADDKEGFLKACLAQAHSQLKLGDPWVVHARYIHSVVDTAVRLQLRYGQENGKPIVGIIIGDTPNHRRDQIKDEFSKGKLNIVCMSDAGAEGINLQRSNRIVLLDVPVSPGRIEQIAGRVHRLGSTRAAQVTLLLPPGNFGTKVFEALRKAASSVFKMAVGGSNFPAKPVRGTDESYYVRQLADYEARLLTAVAETSGAIRSEENRAALERVVHEPELSGRPNTEPLEPLFETGFRLLQEQRERFNDESAATQSSLTPEVQDLVDALVKGVDAHTTSSLDTFRIPVTIIDDLNRPDDYGDLVTREQSFQVLQLENGQRYWYGPQRFLPTDNPQEQGFKWLGVVGNRAISGLLTEWRQERHGPVETNPQPQTWISGAIPRGKALAFCGITNMYRPDGNPATTPGEKTLHVMLGFADYASQELIQWRPFLARGATVSRTTVDNHTWLPDILPKGDKRWAATMIRKVTGLDPGCTTRDGAFENTRLAIIARDSAIKEIVDEEENTTSWRLQKENVKVWA